MCMPILNMPASFDFRDKPVCFRGAKVLVDGRELFIHLSNELDILNTSLHLNGDEPFVIG